MNIVHLSICQRSHGVTLCQILVVQFQGGFVLFSPQKVRHLGWEWVEFLPSIHQILGLILTTPCSRYDSTCQQSRDRGLKSSRSSSAISPSPDSWIFPLRFNLFSNLHTSLGDFGVCSLTALYILPFCFLQFHDFLK